MNPIQLYLNDVFQVKTTGRVFQIIFQDNNVYKFVNIDDRDKIITTSFKQFQKAFDEGQFNIIAVGLARKR